MAKERRQIGIALMSVEAERWLRSCPDMGLAIGELVEIAAQEQLTPPPALPGLRGKRSCRSSVKAEVLRMKRAGEKPGAIAKELNVTRSWVYAILGEQSN